MKSALITGISGFTGKYLADELKSAGYAVYGTVHGEDNLQPGEFQANICDSEQVNAVVEEVQPDVVIHLAAVSSVTHFNVESIYKTNVIGTQNLLSALSSKCKIIPKVVLLASSANVYGNSTDDLISEDTPPNPLNDYSISKLAMEFSARQWVEQLPIVIARPFNYTGVGQSENFIIPKIAQHFAVGAKQIELGNLEVFRDFSDVRDIVRAYRRLIEIKPIGETFNICSGVSFSLSEVINMLSEISKHRLTVISDEKFIRKNEVKSLPGTNKKLADLIGPVTSIPFKDTLRWMYYDKKVN